MLGAEVLGDDELGAIAIQTVNETLRGDARATWVMATLDGFNRIGERDGRMLSLVRRLSEAGAAVTPTLHVLAKPLGIAYVDAPPMGDFDDTTDWIREQVERARRGYEIMASYVAAMHRAGIQLALGTDTVEPGAAALSELRLLRDVGIPMADVLRIGTLGSARVIERPDVYRTIEPGKRADFILFERSPLDDAEALLGGKTVIKDGVVHEGIGGRRPSR
jgi:predicted amidohydrolase YtcJ